MIEPVRSFVPFVEPSKRGIQGWERALFAGLTPQVLRQLARRPRHALCNETFFRCVQLKANIVSTLPVRVVERATKREATEHPVHKLLQQPNSEQTGVEFLLMMLTNYFTHGNCYAEKVISRGQVVELLPMAAYNVSVERQGGRKLYRYTDGSWNIPLDARFVLHVRMFGDGDLNGLSPAQVAEQAILTAFAQMGMIQEAAEKGGVPPMIINLPPEKLLQRLDTLDPAEIAAEANKIQAQIEGARTRLALYLPAGYEGTPLNANFNDLQVQQTADFCRADIARIMGVPLSKLSMSGKIDNGKSAEQDNLAFYQDELRPVIVNLEKRLEADLFTPAERAKFQIKFNVAAILRADLKTQTEHWISMQQQGNYVVDEIREMLDLEPFGTPQSTTPRFPVNQTTEQVAGSQQPTNPAAGGVPARKLLRESLPEVHRRSLDDRIAATRAAYPVFAEAVGRIVRKERAEIGKIVKAALGGRAGTADIEAKLAKMYATNGELRQFIEKNIDKPVKFLFEAIRAAMEAELDTKFQEADLLKVVRKYIDIWARDYAHSSEYQIRDLIASGASEADILDAIEQRLTEWEAKRADKEATEETNRGRNVFAKALYTLAGVSVLRWAASSSACELCVPLDGRTFSPQSIPECPLHRGCECSYTSAK